jgi:hypothetical protein
MIYIILVMGAISILTTLYCGYMTFIFFKALKHSMPSMRNTELWQAERLRQRTVRQRRI